MPSRFVSGLVLAMIASVPLGAVDVQAQIPDKFENLKVLPTDIGKRDLIAVMRQFAGAVGGRCITCHVGESPDDLIGYDFASDEKKEKKIAREMMKMVDEINSNLMTETGVENPKKVRCVTCHRGVEHPETLDRVILASVKEDGGEAAVEKYKMLRTKHYGSGSYDFRPRTLNTVAEKLGGDAEQLDTAIAMARLNLEYDSEQASSHLLLGQLLARKGDKAAAIASVEKSLELDPENGWAKRVLEGLTSEE